MYRRQYAHLTTYTAPGDPISIARQVVADAERLSEHIALTLALMDGICDEHNAHTAGTYEHSQRGPHEPVSARQTPA